MWLDDFAFKRDGRGNLEREGRYLRFTTAFVNRRTYNYPARRATCYDIPRTFFSLAALFKISCHSLRRKSISADLL